ncbi:MAG: VWA domain-containing protein [Thermoguttaceae bacterium]|nr:VWA domain-containing protein [Thermoguttaceae bacterium]
MQRPTSKESKILKARCVKTGLRFGLELRRFGSTWKVVNMVRLSETEAKTISSEVYQSEFVTNDNLIPCQKCGNRKIGGCGCSRKIRQCSASMKYQFDCVYCDSFKIEYENPNYTHVCVVLDASGSMRGQTEEDVRRALINFCVEQRKNAAKDEKIAVDLYQFSDEVKRLAHNSTLDELERRVSQYLCSGLTLLYDAVCQGIDELDAFFNALPANERPADVLFVIVTDGEDTGGKFNAEDAKSRIRRQREEHGWKFVLLVSGVDVNSAAASLGISPSEAIEFNREKAENDIQKVMNVNIANIRTSRNPR